MIDYDETAASPELYQAAISELGYDAKVSSREQLEKVASKTLSRLCIPTNAPKFFVDRLDEAKATQRPIVVVFCADWCGACLKLKNDTLEQADVAKALGTVEVIYLDLDKYPAMGDARRRDDPRCILHSLVRSHRRSVASFRTAGRVYRSSSEGLRFSVES